MGLDMYLEREIYIGSEYKHRNVQGVVYITQDNKQIPINFKKIRTIVENGMYWRKANAIHKWFVYNVQNGEDDCKRYYVSEEKIQELVRLCKTVLKNRDLAKDLLPTQEGFFFGGTSYDEYYFQTLEETAKELSKMLRKDKNNQYVSYYYTSSW